MLLINSTIAAPLRQKKPAVMVWPFRKPSKWLIVTISMASLLVSGLDAKPQIFDPNGDRIAQIKSISQIRANIERLIEIGGKQIESDRSELIGYYQAITARISPAKKALFEEKWKKLLEAGAVVIVAIAAKSGSTRVELLTEASYAFSAALAIALADQSLDDITTVSRSLLDLKLRSLDAAAEQIKQAAKQRDELDNRARRLGLIDTPSAPAGTSSGPENTSQGVQRIGAWSLVSDGRPGSPWAVALFNNHPTLNSFKISCAGARNLSYSVITKGQRYTQIEFAGGDSEPVFPISADGTFTADTAGRFASAVIRGFQEIERTRAQQRTAGTDYVFEVMTPDMKAGPIDLAGFREVRASLRDACSKQTPMTTAQTSFATAAPTSPIERYDEALRAIRSAPGVDCSNGCYIKAGQREPSLGIRIALSSIQSRGSARIDQQGDRILSSIKLTTPDYIFVRNTPEQMRAYVTPFFKAIGLDSAANDYIRRLTLGVNGNERNSEVKAVGIQAYFQPTLMMVPLNGNKQDYTFWLILRCGLDETTTALCR